MTAARTDGPAPATLIWAVRLLLVQAAGLVALTVYLVVRLITADDVRLGVAGALIVLTALGAAAIVVVARALSRRAAGARGPAIVVQLMVIASGGFLVQVGPAWAGLLLMAFGLLVGLLIVLPASTRALGVD